MMIIDPYRFGYSLPPAVAYQYYRLHVFSVRNGGTSGQVYTALFEILDSSGNNILTGGTASASSSQAGSGPELAFNGSTSSGHRNVNNTFPFTLQYQCVSQVVPATLRGYFFNIGAWDLEASNDGSNWTIIASEPAAGWWNNEFSNPGIYYYHAIAESEMWRLLFTAGASSSQAMIYDWELHDSVGGAQKLTGGYPCASSTNGYSFSNIVDGNASTNWANYSTNGNRVDAGNVWCAYILPQGIALNPVEMKLAAHGSASAPTAFTLQKSGDGGKTWVDVKSWSGVSWTPGTVTTKTFAI